MLFPDEGRNRANCGNCGEAFPPLCESQEGRYVQCLFYEPESDGVLKPVGYVCKAWDSHVSAGLAPYWCEPYTKKRRSPEEISANFTPEAVRRRMEAKENNGAFKREAAKLIRRKAASVPICNIYHALGDVPKSISEPELKVNRRLWELYLDGEIESDPAQDIIDAMAPYIH